MLPYDGVPEEAAELVAGADKPAASSLSTRSNAARATTSAWQWDAQWGLYFNCQTKQWAKPLPDGSWEYADAVPVPVPVSTTNDDLPRRTKKKPRRMDRDDPEQEDEKFDPFARVPEEQIWPGTDDDDDDDDERDPYANAPLLRLVVADDFPRPDPTVLPPAHKVASIDPGEPVSIGRDKSYERRIRLRELAVSKSHATLFWTVVDPDPDAEIQETNEGGGGGGGGYWAIVDNGSTHGTFVRAEGEKRFVRLSEAKVASVPHRLYHLDSIRIGSTTFSVHIHPSFACSVCSVASDSSNLIPLVAVDTSKDKNDSSVFLTKTKEQKEHDRREQMAGLKAQFLRPNASASGGKGSGSTARGVNAAVAAQAKDPVASKSTVTPTPPAAAKVAFVDRAAARRQRDAGASVPLPSNRKLKVSGNSSAASAAISPFFTVPGATASATAAVSSSSSSSVPPSRPPVDPFASDSRGAQLLSKLAGGAHPADDNRGINAGSRSSSGQLGTLIEARTTLTGPGERRAGLGSRELVVGVENVAAAASSHNGHGPKGQTNGDWREAGRERSWKRFREV